MLEIEVSREASRCGGSCRIGRRVVKLCAVYGIAPGLSMQQRRGSDRAWVWTACDFAVGAGKVVLLAVWFKLQDVAGSCKQTCDEAKQAHEPGTLITPHISRTNTANASPRVKNAVAAMEATPRETTDLSCGDEACGAAVKALACETPTKSVVSPPKFVFRCESMKNVFSNEKTFPFGNTAAPGSLFGVSCNSSRKNTDGISSPWKAGEKYLGGAEPPKSRSSRLDSKAANVAPAARDGPSNFSFKILEQGECSLNSEFIQVCNSCLLSVIYHILSHIVIYIPYCQLLYHVSCLGMLVTVLFLLSSSYGVSFSCNARL